MRKILSSRLFRSLVCLILVCCMLVLSSPIRVQASPLPEATGVVTKIIPFNPSAAAAGGGAALGVQVFGWVLLGLGLIVTTAQVIDLMNQYIEFSGELEVSIYYYPDGSWSYGVDMSFVDRVRAFLFESGLIINNINFVYSSEQTLILKGSEYVLKGSAPFSVVGLLHNNGYRYTGVDFFAFSLNEFSLNFNGAYKNAVYYGYYYVVSFYSSSSSQDPRPNSDCPIIEVSDLSDAFIRAFFGSKIPVEFDTSIDGAEIGTVAPFDVPIPEGYPEWYSNVRPTIDPDKNEDISVLPIPLDPSIDNGELPDDSTQEDVWPGDITDPLPEMDPGTGTDPDPDSGGSSSGTGSWTPPSDVGKFTLDLKQYFPFCIPFDLYAFFTCLNAEPVAPVIEWMIPLPGGKSYPFEIDLSVFDPVAQILRRMQLLLFCVGLAFKTRDLIKG